MIARADALAAFEEERFDVVVVGGGITGAGVALDAASRGYSVALVERADYACGTSSRSSKLVHGGLRYLQSFDLGLVREALLERQLMVKLAPHLVRPLALLVPGFEGRHPDRLTGAGLNAYDVMASELRRPRLRGRHEDPEEWSPDRHRMIDGDEALALIPALAGRPPSSAYLFYDCQTDDVRLVLSVLGEAERFGTVCANRCEVLELVESRGRADGVRIRDHVGGGEIVLRADNVINATGVWADRLRPEELHDEAEVPHIRPSRGTHILLDRADLPMVAGAIVPAGNGRSIFALPWLGRTLVGTTDNDYDGPLENVRPDAADVDYLLAACNEFFATSLARADVRGAYAGVRPLISPAESKKSVDISRKAELYETSSGMITITGGKLTTWRRMAKLAVDRLVHRDGVSAPCRTDEIQIGLPVDVGALGDHDGVGAGALTHLADRYGHAARDVLMLAEEDPGLTSPITAGLPDLLAEVRFAARREQALTVGDVLLRRTRVGLLDARAACRPDSALAAGVAEALARELGWGAERVAEELAAWTREADAEGIALGPALDHRVVEPVPEGWAPPVAVASSPAG